MTRVNSSMKRFGAGLPLFASFLLCGCLFDRVQQSEEDDIQRVEQKQKAVQIEEARSATLPQREDQLVAELSERQLSLRELNERIQTINGENARVIPENDAARRHYDELIAKLHDTNDRLAAAERSRDGSIEQRREHIATLKDELKAQLDVLLR